MLPKPRRLSRPDFIRAKTQGTTHRFPHFSIIVYSRSSALPALPAGRQVSRSRFAVVTPSTLSKKAVVRNRLRRLIYDQLPTANCQLPTDIIIYPRPSLLNLSHAETGLELNSALSKITPV